MILVLLFLTPLHSKTTLLDMLANTFYIILKQEFATSVVKVVLIFSLTEKLIIHFIDANNSLGIEGFWHKSRTVPDHWKPRLRRIFVPSSTQW